MATTPDRKRVLLVLKHTPYGSSLARAAVDVALAAAAFEQSIDLLFLGDGVLQLFPEQNSRLLGARNMGRQLASLPLYDIDTVYVDAVAARRYGLDLSKTPVAARALAPDEIGSLLTGYDHLLGF